MWRQFIFLALCVLSLVHSKEIDFSQFEKPCPKDDQYVECARRVLEKSWPRFVAGIPDIDLPSLEPLKIDDVYGTTEYGSARGRYNVSNIIIHGATNIKFRSVVPTLKNDYLHLEIEGYGPKLFVEADYDAEGGFNQFVVRGNGHMNVTMTDVTAKVILDGPIVNDRWTIEKVSVTPKIGDMNIWASDLFNGNKELTQAAIVFLNMNWRSFYDVGLQLVQDKLNETLKEFMNRILAVTPFSKTFPY